MARCQHQGDIEVKEEGIWWTFHQRIGLRWTHNNFVEGKYSNKVRVRCLDCGLERIVSRTSDRLPRWIQKALDELEL